MKIGAVLERWRDRLSLQQQVAAITALLCIVLVLSCAAVAAEIARRQAAARVETSILGTANSMAGRLETYMDERFRDVRDLASFKALGASWDADPASIRAALNHLQSSVPDYVWLGFVSTSGNVVAASKDMLEGIPVGDRPWFEAGLIKPTVQDVRDATSLAAILEPTTTGEPHRFVDIAVPVKGPSGATEGVLVAHLNWDWSARIRDYMLSLSASSRQNSIWILRADGHMLLGPEYGSMPLPDAIVAKARSGEQPVFVDAQGEQTLTAVVSASTGILRDLGWIVVVRRPLALAMAEAHQIALTIVGIGLMLAAVGTAGAYLLAARLTLPLAQLTEQVDKLGRDPTATTISRRGGSSDVRHLSSAVRSLLHRAGTAEFARQEAERVSSTMQERFDERTRLMGEHISTLQLQADTDSLTRLLNRRAFLAIATDAMNYFRRYDRDICVLVIDIDFFKRINDTFGHGAGDDVIQFVGATVQNAVRTTDKVARFGGEEFVVLLRETNLANAMLLAERIREQICRDVVEVRNDRTVHVTASVGVARARHTDRDIADVIERADQALYLAKTTGRNKVHADLETAISNAA
jgi:diguanylate cyclase (GGDEF)-like protein